MRIFSRENAEYLICKRLPNHVDTLKVQLDLFKFLYPVKDTFCLRSRNQIFTFVQRKFDGDYSFIEHKILFCASSKSVENRFKSSITDQLYTHCYMCSLIFSFVMKQIILFISVFMREDQVI